MQKAYEVLEGTFALIALVAIVGISTFSVIVLNPNSAPATSTVNAQGNQIQNVSSTQDSKVAVQPSRVAGAFTNAVENSSENRYLINNLQESSDDYQINLVFLGENQGYIYDAKISPSDATMPITKKFIEIYNTQSQDNTLNMDIEIIGAVQDALTVRVMDQFDVYTLYNPQTGSNKIELKLPSSTRRILNIQFDSLQKINFPYEVKIKLN